MKQEKWIDNHARPPTKHIQTWTLRGKMGRVKHVECEIGRSKSHNAQTCNRLTKSKCLFAAVFSHARDSTIFAISDSGGGGGGIVWTFTEHTHINFFLLLYCHFHISQRMRAWAMCVSGMAVATQKHDWLLRSISRMCQTFICSSVC